MTIKCQCGFEGTGKFCSSCGKPLKIFPPKPISRENPDNSALFLMCQQYLNDPDPNEDLEHYIFEAAMSMFYGPTVWEYINAKTK